MDCRASFQSPISRVYFSHEKLEKLLTNLKLKFQSPISRVYFSHNKASRASSGPAHWWVFQSPISRVYFSHCELHQRPNRGRTGSFNPLLVGSTFHTTRVFPFEQSEQGRCFNPLLVGSTFHTVEDEEEIEEREEVFQSPISRVYFSHKRIHRGASA